MRVIDNTADSGPAIGRATADDHDMLRTVFATLLERAASHGGNLTRRDIERVRSEFSPGENARLDRFSAAHDGIIAALKGEQGVRADGSRWRHHLVELYAGDVLDALYPALAGLDGQTWKQIVMGKISALIADWIVPDIDGRLEAARRRLIMKWGNHLSGEEVIVDFDVVALFREVNRRLDEELRDGAEFGKVLCLSINEAVRHALGSRASREMFVGIREADTILDNLVAAQYGNRFRMSVVDPA